MTKHCRPVGMTEVGILRSIIAMKTPAKTRQAAAPRGGSRQAASSAGRTVRYPWQEPVSGDARVYVNTAQPEQLMRQVEWVAYNSKPRRTKREVIEEALRRYMKDEIVRLGADPSIPRD